MSIQAGTTRRPPLVAALLLLVAACAGALVPPAARAETYTFVVQPILPPAQTRAAFQPLADYLSRATGQQIRLVTAVNFLAYWARMKRGDYDLILDAAHFTDWRVKNMDYVVLAKIPDTVSYSLVTGEDTLVLEPTELIGKTVATIGSPSLGAVRLSQLFPNPLRQPVAVEVDNSRQAIDAVLKGRAVAAIVPSPLVGAFPLNVVTTTDPVPHIAMSASPDVPEPVRKAIRKALVEADRTPAGQAMLKAINFPRFVPADAKVYDGYARLLEGVWGYR